MCGRFTLRASASEIAEFFELIRDRIDWNVPRFNIAPTQSILAVRATSGGREPVRLRWGLIPFWAKDTKLAASLINARAETVAEKPPRSTSCSRIVSLTNIAASAPVSVVESLHPTTHLLSRSRMTERL